MIDDIDDMKDPVAKVCADQYPKCRDGLLVEIQPHFAMGYGDCGEPLTEGDIPESSDYVHAFAFPGDCLDNVVAYQTDAANRKARYGHKVMGSYLLTDTLSDAAGTSAYIYYLKAVTDVTVMTETFRWAIACRLAYRLSGVLKPQERDRVLMDASASRDDSFCADSWRRQPDDGEYSWIAARW